jgi:L-iditol 2-dehydrogenase
MLQVNMPEAYKIELLEVPVPEIGDNDVLIEVKRMGICGSDIQIYHGKHKYMSFPIVQGHEGSGIIVRTGKKVTGLGIGEKVTIQPQVFCGKCKPCRMGHYNVCENLQVYGVHTTGMAQEYFAVPAAKVIKLPENFEFDTGALVEPVAVGVGTIRRSCVNAGENVVVLGAGTIGNLTAQVARAAGAKVMITDINSKKLKIAEECGLSICVNTLEKDLGKAIKEYFGNEGADVIIDCAAAKASLTAALNNARRASKIVVVGNFKEPVEIEMPLLQRREVDMIGIMMYLRCDFEEAVWLMAEGKIRTDILISEHFNIRYFEEAYRYIDTHAMDVMKVMLKIAD